MWNFFKQLLKKKGHYKTALNLIYDNNLHTLREKVKILIVDDEDFGIINLLKERKYDTQQSRYGATPAV